MSVQSVVNDERFKNLPPEEKKRVLSSLDSRFKSLSVETIDGVVNGIRASGPPPNIMDKVREADPTQLIKQAAPSNLLKLAGVGGVNAPGIAGAVLNALPGVGNPSQIMPAIQNIQRNPSQGLQAFKRMAAVQGGGATTPQETIPALAGQIAGTGLEMITPSISPSIKSPLQNIKPNSPFTAGMVEPSTALPGALDRANKELGGARTAARAIDDAKETSRLRMLMNISAGKAKLAEEGKAAIEAGADLSVTQLENYGEAMGKMMEKGGSNANDYANAIAKAREMLQWKAPELVEKIEKSAVNYLAKGKGDKIPWITLAINPKVGLMKAATLPSVQNTLGAVVGAPARIAAKAIAPVVNSVSTKAIPAILNSPEIIKEALKPLTRTKAKEFFRKALKETKGDVEAARVLADERATAAGFDTSKK